MKQGVMVLAWVSLAMVNGFFHEKSADHYNVSLLDSSLFGYSMEYLPLRKSLIVGAPNEDLLGRIFEINLRNKTYGELSIPMNLEAKDDRGLWLGATLKAVNDSLVICAPRYTWQDKTFTGPRILGTCFEMDSTLQGFRKMLRHEMIKGEVENNHNYVSGWSLETTADGGLLVGGPGSIGDITKYHNLNGKPQYINEHDTYIQNLGYSIACGQFSKKIKCAVSSTYGVRGYGMIILYDAGFHKLCVVSDQHVGTMFGAALSKVHLGAQYQHLLVGAPLSHGGNTYDVGAVHLYVKDPLDDAKMVFVKKIQGSSNGGYFGNTILSLGDMDGDGKDEVAVAAPYEDEQRGAVYVYTGAALADVNSDNTPAQVIRPEKLLYFGLGLAAVGDFDDNGCNELAIGAPQSNTVVVYRSFASVKIDIDVNLMNTITKGNEVNVTFETCLQFTYPEKPKTVEGGVRYRLEIRNVLYQHDTEVVLDKARLRACQNHSIPIVETEQQILMYEVKNIALKEDPRTLAAFDPTRVLISSDSMLYKSGQFSISDCDGGVCNPVLSVKVTTSMPNNKYAVGSSESEWFSMVVSNQGDTAYAPCVEVEVVGVTILKPGSCSFKDSGKSIVCTPRRALRKGLNWDIEKIFLETSRMTSSDEVLELRYDVYDQCDKPDKKQSNSLKISLRHDQVFSLSGKSSPDAVVNFTRGETSTGNRSVSHIYKIQNDGLTNWLGVKCRITLPKVEYATYQIFFQSDSISRQCPADAGGAVVCDVGNVYRGRATAIYVNVKLAPELLGLVEKKNESRVLTTSIQLLLKGGTDITHSVSTTFQLQYSEVAPWIIILSVCVGLLILVAIAVALYKCGFLRREKKAKLQRLRRNVYRQSVVRSMRQKSRQRSAEDADQLVCPTEDQPQKEQEEQ